MDCKVANSDRKDQGTKSPREKREVRSGKREFFLMFEIKAKEIKLNQQNRFRLIPTEKYYELPDTKELDRCRSKIPEV